MWPMQKHFLIEHLEDDDKSESNNWRLAVNILDLEVTLRQLKLCVLKVYALFIMLCVFQCIQYDIYNV